MSGDNKNCEAPNLSINLSKEELISLLADWESSNILSPSFRSLDYTQNLLSANRVESNNLERGLRQINPSSSSNNPGEQNMGEITETIPRSTTWALFDSVTKLLEGPSMNLKDTEDEEDLLQFTNYVPSRILELLIERAAAEDTSPEDFYEDMRALLSEREKFERKEKPLNKNKLRKLEAKYRVEDNDSHEPYSVNFWRLRYMFPHLYLSTSRRCITPRVDVSMSEEACFIPQALYPHQFGGLIPRGKILSEPVRKALITLHLYSLADQDLNERTAVNHEHLHPRVLQKCLNWQIQNGLLSDEKRVRFLENSNVITPNRLLAVETEKAFEGLKNNHGHFLNEINWNLVNAGNPFWDVSV